jgi:hypothetical protein
MKRLLCRSARGWLGVALMGLAAPSLAQPPAPPAETKAVLELFTSQGCSSCPPADALLAQLGKKPGYVALSYSVDYWNYLGWRDTLSSPANSNRQREYANMRGDGQVYTPQAVIDGRVHVVGSNRGEIEGALGKFQNGLPVPLELSSTDDAITVKIGNAAPGELAHANLWLVMYKSTVTVPIDRGENTGKTITYSNVVRKLRPIAMWKGEAMSVDLPKSELRHADVKRCAVLLQEETKDGLPGPILGAATIEGTW